MSTVPPEQPATPPPPPPPSGTGYGGMGRMPTTGAILPFPGNAEYFVYLIATIVLIVIWAASDVLNAAEFASLFTFLTIGYVLSRGIAKASRVLEQ